MSHVQGSAQEVLADILAKSGLAATDLVLEANIALPPPADNDRNPPPVWRGRYAGQEKGVLRAEDRVLVIAKTVSCDALETRYVFNPFIRTWVNTADRSNPEGNLLWVLFNGKARDFVEEVRKARDHNEMLGSLVRTPRPVTAAPFPVQVDVGEMRNDVLELGLFALESHLVAVHANGVPCNPDVHVYVQPAP
jgi:hypothetical protein